jgi:hypothetical protein
VQKGKQIFAIAGILFGVTLVVCVVTALWVMHGLNNLSFDRVFEPLGIVAKKAASDLVIVKQPGRAGALPSAADGYMVAYEHNPEAFRADAKLFDTWIKATQLATEIAKRDTSQEWLRNSSEIEYLGPSERVDPWGHSFCVLRRKQVLLVLSAGPAAPTSPTCKNIQVTAAELAGLPQLKLLETPAGSPVLVADTVRLQQSVPESSK